MSYENKDNKDNKQNNQNNQYSYGIHNDYSDSSLEGPITHQYENKHNPSLRDIYALLGAMQRQLDNIEHKQATQIKAFTKNDLGEPDYDGHRAYHSRSNKANENLEKYKTGLTKSLLEWIMKGGIAIMGLGIISLIGNRLGDIIK